MLTPADLHGWYRYYEAEPFGHFREDFRSAQIAFWIAKAHFKSPPPLQGFMFNAPKRKAEPMDDDEVKAAMFAWASRINGNNDRKT